MDEVDAYDNGRSFQIRLLLIHPTMDCDQISEGLANNPTRCSNVGKPRRGPYGDHIPGLYTDTRWQLKREFKDARHFFGALMLMFEEIIEPYSEFVKSFIDGGGCVVLNVDAKGTINIGDDLAPESMKRLAAAGVRVGFEVFP